MADEQTPVPDSFVRSAKTIVQSLILAALVGIGAMVMDGNKQIAVMTEDFKAIDRAINDLGKDRYTGSAAAADFRLRDAQIAQDAALLADHDKRIRELEARRK